MRREGPQLSWTHDFGGRTYHFLGVNTAGNDGRAVQPVVPYGDYAGLDPTELVFINRQLSAQRRTPS